MSLVPIYSRKKPETEARNHLCARSCSLTEYLLQWITSMSQIESNISQPKDHAVSLMTQGLEIKFTILCLTWTLQGQIYLLKLIKVGLSCTTIFEVDLYRYMGNIKVNTTYPKLCTKLLTLLIMPKLKFTTSPRLHPRKVMDNFTKPCWVHNWNLILPICRLKR